MTIQYEYDKNRIVIDKRAVSDDFFNLSTGMAGGILQKYINYNIKIAIFGDYSGYTSKPLKDFIRESNEGTIFFFVSNEEESRKKLNAG